MPHGACGGKASLLLAPQMEEHVFDASHGCGQCWFLAPGKQHGCSQMSVRGLL